MWLPLFNTMHLIFIHVVVCPQFGPFYSWAAVHWMDVPPFIYALTSRRTFGLFRAIVNRAAVKVQAQLFVCSMVLFLDKHMWVIPMSFQLIFWMLLSCLESVPVRANKELNRDPYSSLIWLFQQLWSLRLLSSFYRENWGSENLNNLP